MEPTEAEPTERELTGVPTNVFFFVIVAVSYRAKGSKRRN
jgi:hypothetical protein